MCSIRLICIVQYIRPGYFPRVYVYTVLNFTEFVLNVRTSMDSGAVL